MPLFLLTLSALLALALINALLLACGHAEPLVAAASVAAGLFVIFFPLR